MIKQYINVSILLFAGWTVYGSCQNEGFLPVAAGVIVIVSFLLRLGAPEKQFRFFESIPLSVVIMLSLTAGFFWRSFFPAPVESSSPFPEITSAVQAGTIFAAVLIWLKPFSRTNLYRLTFLAWLTAAVSINLPFVDGMLFTFCAFCVLATAIVILHTMKQPKNRKYTFLYYRDFVVFSALLMLLTMGLFFGISKGVSIFDQAFVHLIGDYVMPRSYTHFLKIDPKLRLNSPGRSAWDKRPALEVTVPGVDSVYLKMQIFKTFDNGTWLENEDPHPVPLPEKLDPGLQTVEMTMFAPLERVIPSVPRIAAVEGPGPFFKNDDGIVYTENKQRTRILKFSQSVLSPRRPMTAEEVAGYLALPVTIAPELKALSTGILRGETNAFRKVEILQGFFQSNFEYSLSVGFRADNSGIVRMIKNREPAYCSYFATALTLLLRAEGIPARVVTGFMTNEKIDRRKNKFLARVLDAHAWVEALLPRKDQRTGEIFYSWRTFDPTPAGQRQVVLDDLGVKVARLTERLWLGILRLAAYMENLDKESLKMHLFSVLLVTFAWINRKQLALNIHQLIVRLKRRGPAPYKRSGQTDSIYKRYELYLKNSFQETRKLTETNRELLQRLRKRSDVPLTSLAKMEDFIQHYQAARFGDKKDAPLETLFKNLQE